MTYSEIIDILNFSFGYEDFMRTYNNFLPEVYKAQSVDPEGFKDFIGEKNKIKERFYSQYKEEYPVEILRNLRTAKFINEIDIRPDIVKLEVILMQYEDENEKAINLLLNKWYFEGDLYERTGFKKHIT
jgi:hypothetical protein